MDRKYFGTDGIRGRVGVHPITADFILRMGRAVGLVLAGSDKRAVVIGKDTRISGYMFESALESGLAAASSAGKLGELIGVGGRPPRIRSASIFTSDMSLTITATRKPSRLART